MAHTPRAHQLIKLLQQARRANLAEEDQPAPIAVKPVHRLSRRAFLQTVACGSVGVAAGLAAQAARPLVVQGKPSLDVLPRIAIIGGGIAGLNAAYHLKQYGYTATVYEARNRLGGRIRSRRAPMDRDVTIDLGGAFINSDHEDMLALVDAFGLTLFDTLADAERLRDTEQVPFCGYYFAGNTYSEAEMADRLRPLAAQITADADALDEDFEAVAAVLDQLSVADYLDQYDDLIPEPFIRTLLENTIRSEYGVEPADSSALQLIYILPTVDAERVDVLGSNDEQFVVAGGTDQIIRGLANELEGQFQLRKRLSRLAAHDDGFTLEFNDKEAVEADYVILAIPFPVLRTIPLAVDLPPVLRRFINEVNLGRNEKLFAQFSARVWHTPQGFGQDAWTDLGFSAVWDETQRQPKHPTGILTMFQGGAEAIPVPLYRVQQKGQRFVEGLETHLPGAQAASTGAFARTLWQRTSLTRGAYTNFQPGQYTEFAEYLYIESDDPEESQDVHVGNLVFAGEQVSDFYYGYMNGGAETGRLAAAVVNRLIEAQEEEASRPPTDISVIG